MQIIKSNSKIGNKTVKLVTHKEITVARKEGINGWEMLGGTGRLKQVSFDLDLKSERESKFWEVQSWGQSD